MGVGVVVAVVEEEEGEEEEGEEREEEAEGEGEEEGVRRRSLCTAAAIESRVETRDTTLRMVKTDDDVAEEEHFSAFVHRDLPTSFHPCALKSYESKMSPAPLHGNEC